MALLARLEPRTGALGERDAVLVRLELEVVEPARQPGVGFPAPDAAAAHETRGLVAAGAEALGDQHVARVDAQRPADHAAVHAVWRDADHHRRDRPPRHVA